MRVAAAVETLQAHHRQLVVAVVVETAQQQM
jgi:hypothetical protein